MKYKRLNIFFVYYCEIPFANNNLDWVTFGRNNKSQRNLMTRYYKSLQGFFVIDTPADYLTKIIHKLGKSDEYVDLSDLRS